MSETSTAAQKGQASQNGNPPKSPGRPKHTRIDGAALMPDPKAGAPDGSTKRVKFWIGVTNACPRESIDLCGVNFPKLTTRVVPKAGSNGLTNNVPQIGAIVDLTETQFAAIMERVPRTVVRFTDGKPDTGHAGDELGDETPVRRGHIITIPTEDDLAARRKAGRSAREYIKQPGDVGAAAFIFLHMCKDQDKGERGASYPNTLDVAGASWPYPLSK